jgi:exosortase A
MKRDPLPLLAEPATVGSIRARTWRIALAALVLALVWIGLWYWSTAAAIVGIWIRSETFAHGFVVAPISLWLIYRMRHRLASFVPRPGWIAFPFLAIASFVWLLGKFGAVNAVSQVAFVAMLVLAVPAVLGLRVTRAIVFPLGFLFFSVPLGEFLLPTLMDHTANFTVFALRASGVPVYREGLQLVIPNGRWSIVEACSGIRYLVASLMVGTLFAYLNYRTIWRRWMFVAVSIVVPIVANWMRAYLIVMLGYLSDNKLATGVDHLIYGWLFFGFVMLVMFWIGSLWHERTPAKALQPQDSAGQDITARAASPARLWCAALAVIAVTLAWPLVISTIQRGGDPAVTLNSVDVPGWNGTPVDAAWTPHFETPSAVRHESLRRGSDTVGLYVAYYRGQTTERKLVSSNNVLVQSNDKVWARISEGRRDVMIDGAPRAVATEQIRGHDGQSITAWKWYWAGGRLTSSDVVAKALIAWSGLTGQGDDSAVIVVYAPANAVRRPEQTLEAFTREAWPSIAAALEQAKAHR